MHDHTYIEIRDQAWLLLPDKAAFWVDQKMLIVSDIHLGKSGHFRKSGIAAPVNITQKTLERLGNLIENLHPETVLFLGDLFHSEANREWFLFESWLENVQNISFKLVSGNHDVLHSSFYKKCGIEVYPYLDSKPFLFVHDLDEYSLHAKDQLTVAGHVHPCITVRGKGRQSLRLPCFLFSESRILFPAFGDFTGMHSIKPLETDRVYVVVDHSVIELNQKK